jgi:hypothetical protein
MTTLTRGRRRAFHPLRIVRVQPTTPISAEPDPLDETPDAFSFFDVVGAVFGSTQTSNTITVSGMSDGALVAAVLSGDASSELQKNGAPWIPGPIAVTNGDTLAVRHTATILTSTTLTVGGVSDTFTSTTVGSGTAGQPTGLLLAITRAA